jgi:hypothetical protein
VQIEPFEQQQGKEQVTLTPGEPSPYSPASRCTLIQEGDGVGLDVGILADLVRVRMVPAVLVHPPAMAEAHQRGQHLSGAVVRLTGLKNLAVGCLMPQEGKLREDYAESAGQQQLQPRVLEQDHPGGTAGQSEHTRTAKIIR